jgi:dTDP-4-dehydrorhamnose reductase
MEEIAVDFEKREFEKGLETGYQYNTIYNYDLTEEIRRWVKCNTEQECKQLLQHMYNEREITIGEFTKAILKISALNNEIMGVCEISGEVALGLLHKIKDVNGLILKYIATTQSLYV